MWAPALAHERCNFHPSRAATVSYIGTPLCDQCASRLSGEARAA